MFLVLILLSMIHCYINMQTKKNGGPDRALKEPPSGAQWFWQVSSGYFDPWCLMETGLPVNKKLTIILWVQTKRRDKWITTVTAISTPTAVAKAWKWCRGTVPLNKTCWKQAGSVHETFDLPGLVQICVGYLCWSAGKWISDAFTISLWFWEPAWEEKTGIANVKMLILC